ncbi:hypothetical protein WA026_017104 [Henosepilachna vigintioctopunctata]|uniref:Uncharacterized protein n=1 Tax=Henosepilachna vigintioctopunctata TaxID=420089 RepID=A0AAW1TVG7_9CUCU
MTSLHPQLWGLEVLGRGSHTDVQCHDEIAIAEIDSLYGNGFPYVSDTDKGIAQWPRPEDRVERFGNARLSFDVLHLGDVSAICFNKKKVIWLRKDIRVFSFRFALHQIRKNSFELDKYA